MLRLVLLFFAFLAAEVAADSNSGKKQPTDTDVVEAEENLGALKGHGTTPLAKVLHLLKNVREQVEDEGKKEAAAYDKFACFCKEQADEKLYNIETSDRKIKEMAAIIAKLTSDISELNSDVADLSKLILDREWEIGNATQQRAQEHETYVEREADTSAAIDACDRAIAALKDSKSNLEGKASQNAFAQIKSVARRAFAMEYAFGGLSEKQSKMLSYFANHKVDPDGVAEAGEAGAAYTYTYHSNDIISTIQDLRKKFIVIKDDLDTKEFELKKAFDSKVLGLTKEKEFMEEEKKTKEKIIAYKTEVKEQTEDDKARETVMKNADNDFLTVVKNKCEKKAGWFDSRSQVRADEVTALSKAIDVLESGAKPNEGANKKLVGLQTTKNVDAKQKAPTAVLHTVKPVTFLQLRGSNAKESRSATSETNVKQRLLSVLFQQAELLKSGTLSTLALRVQTSEDHFMRVRQLIKDLIRTLQDQAAAEQTTKMYCDAQMKIEVTNRDDAAMVKEEKSASITEKEGELKNAEIDIAALSKQISDNQKALLEETELRNEESNQNAETRGKAQAGKAAVEEALRILRKFYTDNALIQYVPPDSDRDGNTFGDLAGEADAKYIGENDKTYHGKQEKSKGIIGLLEVILSDFDRTDTTVRDDESQAVTDYNTFKTDNEQDTSTKEGTRTTKENRIDTLESDLDTLETDLDDAKKAYDLALQSLEDLRKMCVEGEESYEERVEKRMKEIEALKEAHNILENWQS